MSNSELAGNTLLLSSEDGQQQCVYVTTGEEGEEGTILTLDSAYADAVAQLGTDQVLFIVWYVQYFGLSIVTAKSIALNQMSSAFPIPWRPAIAGRTPREHFV